MTNEERACLKCGQKFAVTHPNKRCCSLKCTRDFNNHKRPKVQKAERACLACKKPFTTSKPNKAYCSRKCFLVNYTPTRRLVPGQDMCPVCKEMFVKVRADKVCCSKRCAYALINRSRPRKTARSYVIPAAMKKIPIPKDEMEIIYGCLLGDSGLVRSTDGFHIMSFCHGEAQVDYMRFKLSCLPSIIRSIRTEPIPYLRAPYTFDGREIGEKMQYHRCSISHPSLSGIHRFFYRRGKPHVDPGLLKILTPTSLLFWYLDDGSYSKSSKAAYLCTHAYKIGTVSCIKKWFWRTHRIDTRIRVHSKEYNGKIRHYPVLHFTTEGTARFFEILKTSPLYNQLPSCMAYKLGNH